MYGTDCSLPEYEPNVFLMSVILFLGTFITSVILKDFKNALFFPSKVSNSNFLPFVLHTACFMIKCDLKRNTDNAVKLY